MEKCVELRGVRKSFGSQKVLRGIDLSIGRGEILGLLGLNGSGKSTTLRIIAGFLAPDTGRVAIDGIELNTGSHRVRAKVGYLPERPPLYDPFSVEQYLNFVASAKGIVRKRRAAAISAVLEAFALTKVRTKIIATLSKGFRQRVGLAQSSLGEPEVWLLDEATNGLDPDQLHETRELIRAGSINSAVVFSSHIMQDVAVLCDRIAILHNGRIVSVDRPTVLTSREKIVDIDLGGVTADEGKLLLSAVPEVKEITVLPDSLPDVVKLRCVSKHETDIRDQLGRAAIGGAVLLGLKLHEPNLEDLFHNLIADAQEKTEK